MWKLKKIMGYIITKGQNLEIKKKNYRTNSGVKNIFDLDFFFKIF